MYLIIEQHKQKLLVCGFILIGLIVLLFSNFFLTERFAETTKTQSQLRAVRQVNEIIGELKRSQIVPFLLSQDRTIISGLLTDNYKNISERLASFASEIGLSELRLFDSDGNLVASSKVTFTKRVVVIEPHKLTSDNESTVFKIEQLNKESFKFSYLRPIVDGGKRIGYIVADVNLNQFEERWRSPFEAVLITDINGQVVISTEQRWKGKNISEALLLKEPKTALNRAFHLAGEYLELNTLNNFLDGQAVMRVDVSIPYNSWELSLFSSYKSVRERVNAALAIEIMIFSIIVALLFYGLNRRAQSQTIALKKESDELRALNLLLKNEVSIRKKVEQNLEVVEQSLIQSQKLAVLGEMSAAVSHELNQPLAAMKTYLAAAKLLFDRRRTQEALSSLQRIDDLIERMGVITKQLKSHARKVSDSMVKIDLREVVANSIAIMELNFKQDLITIQLNLGKTEVMVLGDPIRLEQVLINLIRNSLDAVKAEEKPIIVITLLIQENAILQISDNGNGIEDFESLFEPFYTTKEAGDGLGLGLSISSSIITDYGGRLTARNSEVKGAIFEIELPLLRDDNFNILTKDN